MKLGLYTYPKYKKMYAVYNGIYFTWNKNTCTPNARNEIQSFVGMLNFISWGVSLYKKYNKKA